MDPNKMSVSLTFKQVNKPKINETINSLFPVDKGLVKKNEEKIEKLTEELNEIEENAPDTEEETYSPKYQTKEHKAEIDKRLKIIHEKQKELDELRVYPSLVNSLNRVIDLKKKGNTEDYEDFMDELVVSISENDKIYWEYVGSVEPYIHLFLKYTAGLKDEWFESLDGVPQEAWIEAFGKLDKESMTQMKTEIDIAEEGSTESYMNWEILLEILKEIKEVFEGCNGKEIIFSVEYEGDDWPAYHGEFKKLIEDKINLVK